MPLIRDARTPAGRFEPDVQRFAFSTLDSPVPINETGRRWTNGFIFSRPELPRLVRPTGPRARAVLKAEDRGPCHAPGCDQRVIAAHPYAKTCSARCRKRVQMARQRAAA
jgi:hypothetical protein